MPPLRDADAQRRIAIACGGTAGHVFPALAVAEAYRRLCPDTSFLFLGRSDAPEATLVPRWGHRFEALPASPFFGVRAWRRAMALSAALAGFARARRLLARERTQLLIGFGGHPSFGAALAAASLGIPIVVHELNAQPGLANWLLARLGCRVLLGFEAAAAAFGRRPTTYVGVPVTREILGVGERRQRAAGTPFRVLVLGGSQGSRFLDEHVPDLMRRLEAAGVEVQVRHQAAAAGLAGIRAAYARLGIAASVTSFLDDMPEAYAWADLAVACGGGSTLAELAAVGLPCLLVPLAGAALDHQTANVRCFAEVTGALWTPESQWDPERLASDLAALARCPEARLAAAAGMRSASWPLAAERVADVCEAALHETFQRRPAPTPYASGWTRRSRPA